MMDICIRFAEILKNLGKNANSLSKELGLSQTALKKVITGEHQPSSKVLIPLLEKYPQVNSNWLLTGRGEMFLKETISSEKDKLIEVLEKNIEDLRKHIDSLEKQIKK